MYICSCNKFNSQFQGSRVYGYNFCITLQDLGLLFVHTYAYPVTTVKQSGVRVLHGSKVALYRNVIFHTNVSDYYRKHL